VSTGSEPASASDEAAPQDDPLPTPDPAGLDTTAAPPAFAETVLEGPPGVFGTFQNPEDYRGRRVDAARRAPPRAGRDRGASAPRSGGARAAGRHDAPAGQKRALRVT